MIPNWSIFPLFFRKCRTECIINVKQFKIEVLEKIKNLKKTNLPYDFDDEYFDSFDDGDEPDDTTLETLFLNIPVIKDSIKKKIGIVFKYLSYAIDNDEVVLVGKDKRVLPHSLVFNDGKYYLKRTFLWRNVLWKNDDW